MSTTIQYKGDTLATVSNNTKTLKTAGKYMEGDVVLTDVSGGSPSLQTKTKTYTPTTSQQTESVTADNGYDGLDEVDITVNAIQTETLLLNDFSTSHTYYPSSGKYYSRVDTTAISTQTKTVEPSESAKDVMPDSGKYLSKVTVNAIPSNYVGSGITQRSSSDLTVSGATVTAPSGYYSASASKSVASGTAGTPIATKGTVSNHSISVTPSVTNTTGYITGSTKTGTAVSVSASELVSGTLSVNSAGTKDVTNYASASIPSGTEGTPTATKGTVSNHSVSVTPSVTNTSGFINGSTKTGTAVTVSARELVSGSETKTANGTYDVTNLASLVVNVPSGEDGDNLYYGSVDLTGTSWTFDNAPTNLPEEETEFLHINLTAKHLSGSQLNSYNSLDFVDNQYGTMIVYGGNIAYDAGTWYEDKTINITGGTDATSKELYNILKANATQTI